jgi:hypothetical protein
MEEIIHHKIVKEVFTKCEKVVLGYYDPALDRFMDDIENPKSIKGTVELVKKQISLDELKKAMSADEEVTIDRNTIIVSEDLIKNTISLKVYQFKKIFVRTPKSKKRKFKFIVRKFFSLTINKSTGDFSIYTREKKRNKSTIFIRKNISNMNIRGKINNNQHMRNDASSQIAMDEAIKIFYRLLGYQDLGVTYTDTIRWFFNTNPNDRYNKNGLQIFPFLNYLRVNDINIISYHALYYFERIFSKDKAKYRGLNIINYMADYYKIKDKLFLQTVLFKMIEKNEIILNTIDIDKKVYWSDIQQSELCFIDYTKLRLFHDLNKIPTGRFTGNWWSYFNDMLPIGYQTSYDEIYSYPEIAELVKLYNLPLTDVFGTEKTKFDKFMNQLKIFKCFGVKLKINDIRHYENTLVTHNKILYNLFESANKTGTYQINKKTLTRIKQYFRGCKLDFITIRKFKEKYKNYGFLHVNAAKEDGLYTENSLQFTFNVMKEGCKRFNVTVNPVTKICECNNIDLNDYDKHAAYNFSNKFQSNRSGLASSFKVRILFSKTYFEKLCQTDDINIRMYIDYLGNNG